MVSAPSDDYRIEAKIKGEKIAALHNSRCGLVSFGQVVRDLPS